ncbi:hypothetical protein [Nannocystis bainbridge]|uniref:Lipoprotein n=1 Tax=Nannocystis bainbridge TaxID=2995303 RepID=A0ABT5EBE4_9BACT|nr:hypothetical protein [Nannocystis bainbridge]MDC0723184.1 hypothetical protein [Nannocystis bainbridge]
MRKAATYSTLSMTLALAACMQPPMPGDLPNPQLVELFNKQIDLQLARFDAPYFPGSLFPPYLPGAADSARRWLSEVREVATHCRHGGRGNVHNPHEYDLTLQSGETFTDLTTSFGACLPKYDTPMRVSFEGGRVAHVTTDGSERQSPMEVAESRIERFVGALLDRDTQLRPELYYSEVPKPADPKREWAAP